jgi:hypothetical protein
MCFFQYFVWEEYNIIIMSNIVVNGNFDAGLSDWIVETSFDGGITWNLSGDIVIDPTQGIGGGNCAQYTLVLGTVVRLKQESIPVISGETYVLQYFRRRDLNVPEAGVANVQTIYEAGSPIVIYQTSPSTAPELYGATAHMFTVPPGITKIDLTIVANYFEFTPQPSPKEAFYVDEISIFHFMICYSGASIVMTKNIQTNEEALVRADCLDPSRHLVFRTDTKEFIPLKIVVRAGRTMQFFRFLKDSLGENQPSETFFITSGHHIIHNGVSTKVRDLPNRKRVNLVEPEDIYTLVCDVHCPILINNLQVIVYSMKEWERSRHSLMSMNVFELHAEKNDIN